jgi:hypothetical protein
MEWKCTSYKTFLPILSLYWTRSTFFTSTSPQAEPLTGSVLTRDKFKEVLHSDQSENLINISLWGTRRLVLSGLHAFHNHKTMEQLVRNVRFFYPSWKMIIPWWRTRPSPGCWSKATWRSSIGQKSSVGASYQNTSSFGQAVIGVDWSSNPVSSGTIPMSEMESRCAQKTAFANMGICSTPNHTKLPGSREHFVSPFTRSTPKEGVATTVVATGPAWQWI